MCAVLISLCFHVRPFFIPLARVLFPPAVGMHKKTGLLLSLGLKSLPKRKACRITALILWFEPPLTPAFKSA